MLFFQGRRASRLPLAVILRAVGAVKSFTQGCEDFRLEGITHAELQYARRSLNADKPHPVHGDVVHFESRGIKTDSESGTALSVRGVHPLRVGNVECFNSELQPVVFTPRQVERLSYSHVEIDVTRQPEHVSISRLARKRIAETSVSFEQIAVKEPAASYRTRLDRTIRSHRVALRVPVSGPTSIVERSADGQAGIPAEDARHLPSTNNSIYHFTSVTEEASTTSEWKLPQSIRVDDMTN